ncbi:DUF6114 domain-containing protein [Streptomyces sp. SCSIO 30461]|uniref:DUF6114 domain-containing protein n=1 Tax=Streptomyces sp. SCSIO 30461 TaxID=3118085 RepID=UPI0030D0C878
MSVAESTGQNEHFLRVLRRRFRDWRGQRPFWGGLFTLLGGMPIAYFPYASLKLGHMTLSMATTAGAGSLIIGVLLVTLGLTMWYQPLVRVFAGVAAVLLALISIPVSNLGGFIMGYLFALIGGALALAWAPGKLEPEEAEAHEETYASGELPTAQDPEPQGMRDGQTTHETTIDANGGRNSAG